MWVVDLYTYLGLDLFGIVCFEAIGGWVLIAGVPWGCVVIVL